MSIHTFDSRDFIFWEVFRDHFNKSNEDIYNDIRILHSQTIARLDGVGVKYKDLKNTLTPQKNKMEIAFVFDSTKIDDVFYGKVVLDGFKKTICSIRRSAVFLGDIVAGSSSRNAQLNIRDAMREEIFFYNELNYINGSQYFIVYFNNVTSSMLSSVLGDLKSLPHFIGYCDLSFSSYLKDVVSMSIGQSFLLHDGIALMQSIDGETEGVNTSIFNLEGTGIKIINIDEFQYNSFLKYKIKRRYFPMDNEDQIFSINSVTPSPELIKEYDIYIEDNKFKYLLENKEASIKKLSKGSMSKEDIKRQIVSNINTNYMFNMELNSYGCLKFNTDIEVCNGQQEKSRCIASFEIDAGNKRIRLLTLY